MDEASSLKPADRTHRISVSPPSRDNHRQTCTSLRDDHSPELRSLNHSDSPIGSDHSYLSDEYYSPDRSTSPVGSRRIQSPFTSPVKWPEIRAAIYYDHLEDAIKSCKRTRNSGLQKALRYASSRRDVNFVIKFVAGNTAIGQVTQK